ncbi:hypothetical protein FKP32DRAFT_794703 [Trametes sanguinea]|nr:hypothetical protein FKP32DRAFT_794703 [Trametes sanguinea]
MGSSLIELVPSPITQLLLSFSRASSSIGYLTLFTKCTVVYTPATKTMPADNVVGPRFIRPCTCPPTVHIGGTDTGPYRQRHTLLLAAVSVGGSTAPDWSHSSSTTQRSPITTHWYCNNGSHDIGTWMGSLRVRRVRLVQ